MTDRSSLPPVAPGDLLAGKYRVERVLGAGGMGVVVEARHIELEQRVALKFLLPHAVTSSEATARFLREARAAVRIQGEHVARVTDVGRLDDGAPYIVMEFLEGMDLGAVVEKGPLPLEDAIDFVLQACEAMAEAHAAGIIHRDLKPANLFLTQRPGGVSCVKVLDFGISKMTEGRAHEVGLTQTAALIGSPLYMSPEQLRSARGVDHRTDIWSLGVILFEFLTGTVPFTASTLPQLIATILEGTPTRLAERRPDLPPGLEAVVSRALSKDAHDRHADVGELAAALAPFAPERSRHTLDQIARMTGARSREYAWANRPTEQGVPGASSPPVVGAGVTRTHDAWSGTRGASRRAHPRAAPVALAVVALALTAALGGWWATQPSRAARTSSPESASGPAMAAIPAAKLRAVGEPPVSISPSAGLASALAGTSRVPGGPRPVPPSPPQRRAVAAHSPRAMLGSAAVAPGAPPAEANPFIVPIK
jgi:serine/threonine protein kinase